MPVFEPAIFFGELILFNRFLIQSYSLLFTGHPFFVKKIICNIVRHPRKLTHSAQTHSIRIRG